VAARPRGGEWAREAVQATPAAATPALAVVAAGSEETAQATHVGPTARAVVQGGEAASEAMAGTLYGGHTGGGGGYNAEQWGDQYGGQPGGQYGARRRW
jgi:hypothetical protein